MGSLSAIHTSVCIVNVFYSFPLQATLQICLQEPCASAALREKLQLLPGGAAAMLQMYSIP